MNFIGGKIIEEENINNLHIKTIHAMHLVAVQIQLKNRKLKLGLALLTAEDQKQNINKNELRFSKR